MKGRYFLHKEWQRAIILHRAKEWTVFGRGSLGKGPQSYIQLTQREGQNPVYRGLIQANGHNLIYNRERATILSKGHNPTYS